MKIKNTFIYKCKIYVLVNGTYIYMLVNGTITITGDEDDDAAKRADERDKGAMFKNCAPFTKYINTINNT